MLRMELKPRKENFVELCSIKLGGPHFVLDYGTSMMLPVMKYDLKITSLSNKRCILVLYYTKSTIQNLM